jgi:hypothetical protein
LNQCVRIDFLSKILIATSHYGRPSREAVGLNDQTLLESKEMS